VNSAFEQIRMYSKSDLAVSLRMLRALGDIATTCTDPAYRRKLWEVGTRIVEGCSEKLREEEVSPMRLRLGALEKVTAQAAHHTDTDELSPSRDMP
jgi:uncharacterized membrane protein